MSSLAMLYRPYVYVSVQACGVEPWAPNSSKVSTVWLVVPQLSPASLGVVDPSWAIEQTK